AGAAQPGHVPAARHDLDFGARKEAAPIQRLALGAEARLAVVEDLEAAQHPAGLRGTAAETPAAGDPVAALDRHRLPAALHRGAGAGRIGPLRVKLVHPLVRQAERDELDDAVVGEVPADRAAAL